MRRTATLTFALLLTIAPAASAQTPTTQPRIAAGVSAAGVDLSNATLDEATGRLYATFGPAIGKPMSTHVAGRKFGFSYKDMKLSFDAAKTARRALNAGRAQHTGNVDVPLVITYDAKLVDAYAQKVATTVAKSPRDASVKIGLKKITKVESRDGRSLDAKALSAAVEKVLTDPRQDRIIVPKLTVVHPKITTGKLGSAYSTIITVDRGEFKLRLFKNLKLSKTYPVAVGQPAYPTPTGQFSIHDKAVNPQWNVPNSPWAGALANETVPGGSEQNPLKARWMGIVNGVGIHGTDQDGSIGTRASHGCIRMHISDVIDLYPRVPVGTPVLIGD
jgi:lipoprotein-anchoring transpeptidase ErfK/SrfK